VGKRVLVVEDELHVTNLLRLYLERAGYEVTSCADGARALETVRQTSPDLVILDLMLPGKDGLSICRELREEGDLPVIMLTARTTEQDRLRGLRDGADDYVTKPFSPAEVVLRVEAVLRRSRREPPSSPLRAGPVELDPDMHRVTVHGREVPLTPSEFRLLQALMASPGRTFSRQQLLDRIAGPDFAGFDRNVDVHVANLRKKLGLRPSPVRTVYGVGYRFHWEPAAGPGGRNAAPARGAEAVGPEAGAAERSERSPGAGGRP
jgi:DNA-binding response OmpR family regulator